MKDRLRNKTDIQKDLDRKLVEQIGNPDEKPKINLLEIKKLVERGATIDHWVNVSYDGDFVDSIRRYNDAVF